MREYGAFEAKTHLSELLDLVSKGERVRITRRGEPVAVLVPVEHEARMTAIEAAAAIRALRVGTKISDREIRELIEEGRR
jgi:prevent-host-death family protein